MLARQCADCGASFADPDRPGSNTPVTVPRKRAYPLTEGQRWAGWLFFVQAGLGGLAFVVADPPSQLPPTAAFLLPAFVDAMIALQLLAGSRRIVSFAIARQVFGGILWIAVFALGREYLHAIGTAAINFSVAYLMLTDVDLRRRRVAVAAFVLGLGTAALAEVIPRDHGAMQARAVAPPPPGGPVVGRAAKYTLQLPSGWRPIEPFGNSDVLFEDTSRAAALHVQVSKLDGAMSCLDAAVASMAETRTVLEKRPLANRGDRGLVAKLRWKQGDQTLDGWFGLFMSVDHMFQVVVGAPAPLRADLADEFQRIVDSFEFPPGTPALPDNGGPVQRFESTQPRYSVDFPAHWYRMPGDGEGDGGDVFALQAFRPYRCAKAMVEVLPAPTPFRWKDHEAGMLEALGAEHRVELLERRLEGTDSLILRAVIHAPAAFFDAIVGLRRIGKHVVAVRAVASRTAFTALEPELRGIVQSLSSGSGAR